VAEMITGQLYRVGLTCIAAHERCTVELLLIAANNEDAKARVPWVYDLSDFSSYRIDFTAKEPGRCSVLKQTYKRTPETEPDANVLRDEGSQGFFTKPPSEAGKKWSVVARTVCYAKDGAHAAKKLAQRIDGGSDMVQWVSEELHASSPFATARDTSMFPKATFVRG